MNKAEEIIGNMDKISELSLREGVLKERERIIKAMIKLNYPVDWPQVRNILNPNEDRSY